jgi:epoxide hydrolase-like predicted phosphatase
MKIKKRSEIKVIIFDIGGVLFLGDKKIKYGHQNIKVHEYMSKKFNLSLKSWLKKIEKPYEKSITGEWTKKKVLLEMSKSLNANPEKLNSLFIKAHKKNFKKNKKLFRKTKKLSKNYTTGILSDQTYFSKEALIKKKDMKYFNLIILSCEFKTRKPNLKIYRLFKKQLNKSKKIKYSEILFIDNRGYNIKPAKKLGMKTILFKNNKQIFKELNKILDEKAV